MVDDENENIWFNATLHQIKLEALQQKHKGSMPRYVVDQTLRNKAIGHQRIGQDYFTQTPTYDESFFKMCYKMC